MHEFDMSGTKKLGMMSEGVKGGVGSICWDCKRPTGKCTWLMAHIPYEGSEYWERVCYYENHTTYSTYAIVSCPMEVK